ncbi:hypothetical protein ACSBR2_018847 [Camellia fascicularis]
MSKVPQYRPVQRIFLDEFSLDFTENFSEKRNTKHTQFSNQNQETTMVTISNPNPNSGPKPLVYLQDKEEVKKVLNRFDTNGDNKISAMELI